MLRMDHQLDVPGLLVSTPQGSLRVAGTRVSLDSVIHAFWEGATPEEICQDFPSLPLAQVYGIIAYYLNHRDKVDAYIQTGHEEIENLQKEFTARHKDFLTDLRRRLTAPRQSPTTP